MRARLASVEALVREEVGEGRSDATTDEEDEDVRAVAVELLIEEEANAIVASGPGAADPFTADRDAAALAALRAEEGRRIEAKSAFLAWTKRKEQAASLRRAANAAEAAAKARTQAIKAKDAEEAYSTWLQSSRGRSARRDLQSPRSTKTTMTTTTMTTPPFPATNSQAQRSPLALTSIGRVLGRQLDEARAGLQRLGVVGEAASAQYTAQYEEPEQSVEQRRSALSSRFREKAAPSPAAPSPSRFEAAAVETFEAQLRALEALKGEEDANVVRTVDVAGRALERLRQMF
jgi:hypothetical protein